MKRLIREPEKPSFPAQCRVLAEAAVLWALLAAGAQLLLPAEKTALPEGAALGWAAGAQLLLPAEKTALPEGAALGWAALRICLVTPLAEELAFRGGGLYLLQPLGGAGAVVVQAVLFAALHGSWTARAYALGMGLIFGWAARKAKSVWPGSALHIINNCLVFAARLAERGMG